MNASVKIGIAALACCLWGFAAAQDSGQNRGEEHWWRGNTHAHTWWSDGDMPPELVAQWYKDHGYQFLVLSDHNTFQEGIVWYPIDVDPGLSVSAPSAYLLYVERFGAEWVEVSERDGKRSVRLKTFDEIRPLFEAPDEFTFIKGEEITGRVQNHPLHLNGLNLIDYVKPQELKEMRATAQAYLDRIAAQSAKYRQPMLVHLNHPNLAFGVTAEDFFALDHKPGEGFFEIYSGHADAHNAGDAQHESSERMWDIVLAKRLGEFGRSVIYGVASDDAHDYQMLSAGRNNPGRGWIMVRANSLSPNTIVEAIQHGDFYGSTGISLARLEMTDEYIQLEVDGAAGIDYKVEFIGTLQDADLDGRPFKEPHAHEDRFDHMHQTIYRYSADIGKVLKTVNGTQARYDVQGNEIYVRARITSSRPHPNPSIEGEVEMAWTQPLVVIPNDSQR